MSATYGVLGVGALGAAIVTGLCERADNPPSVLLSPRSALHVDFLERNFPTVKVSAGNQAVLDGADTVLVCLRRAHTAILADLTWRRDHVVVSTVAGLGVHDLLQLVAPATRVCRSIPLPPVAVNRCLTAVHPPVAEARELFDGLGSTLELEDVATFEALSAATSTAAAFLEYLGTQTRWLEKQGVAPSLARRYVAAMYVGIMDSCEAEVQHDFIQLAAEHATKGGVNEYVASVLRESGTFKTLDAALDIISARLAT